MTTLLIFTWYLLTTPADKLICSLWVSQPPTPAALMQSCGTNTLSKYRLDVLDIYTHALICSRPADALAVVQSDCHLGPLDRYRLQIIEPNRSELVCPLTLTEDHPPVEADVAAQCPSALDAWKTGGLSAKFIGKQQIQHDAPMCAAPNVPFGTTLYSQPYSKSQLATDEPLTWLAGRMIWFGLIKPACNGGASGLDPFTLNATECGLQSARNRVTEWQNQFDDAIYSASLLAHVPARLLKRMMRVESQFWPLYVGDANHETGVMQVSANGADVMLRYDASLDADYPVRTMDDQYWSRLDLLNNKFACSFCSLERAVDHTREIIPMYARLLAAYRCRAVEINPALSGDQAWRQAVIDYNGSADYLSKVE